MFEWVDDDGIFGRCTSVGLPEDYGIIWSFYINGKFKNVLRVVTGEVRALCVELTNAITALCLFLS